MAEVESLLVRAAKLVQSHERGRHDRGEARKAVAATKAVQELLGRVGLGSPWVR